MKSFIEQSGKSNSRKPEDQKARRPEIWLSGFLAFRLLCSILSFLLFIVSGLIAEVPTLPVLNAEGEKIASLEVLGEQKYVLLGEIAKLFSGTIRSKPIMKQITVTIRGKQIVFTLNRHQLEIDGEKYVLSDAPASISGRVAIPVEFLTEILPNVIGRQITLDRENWELHLTREPFVKEDELATDSHRPPEPDSAEFRVIIDPGHGGRDAGAKSKDGLLEKDLTFMLAQRMRNLLAAKEDIDVCLTRGESDYRTVVERVNLANKLRGHVYLSIHFNCSPLKLSRGFRVYVNSNRMRLGTGADLGADMFLRIKPAEGETSEVKRFLPQSKRLAREIANELRSIELPGEQEKEVFLAAMDNLSMPGVLVEVLYLSNPQDLTIINSRPGFMDTVAQSLCDSVLAFRAVLEDRSEFAAAR